jgi:hypothetical protein
VNVLSFGEQRNEGLVREVAVGRCLEVLVELEWGLI